MKGFEEVVAIYHNYLAFFYISFRSSQVPVARNPSITSAQLNAAAPLVRVTRIPSTRFDTIGDYQFVRQTSTVKTTSIRASIKTKAREIFSRPATPKSTKSTRKNLPTPSSETSTDAQRDSASSVNPVSVLSEYSSTSRSSTISTVVLGKQRPKSLYAQGADKVSVNQRESAVNPKFLARSNAFLKPKESEENSRNRYRGVSVPNLNASPNRSRKVGEQLLGPLAGIKR